MITDAIQRGGALLGVHMGRKARRPDVCMLGLRDLPVKAVVDVGAHRGSFARRMAKIFPRAHLVCIEPQPEPFAELTRWAASRGSRVTTFQGALGDHTGSVSLRRLADHLPSSSILKTTPTMRELFPATQEANLIEVPLTTLDALLADRGAAYSSDLLLKLDVQGYEMSVLRGAERSLPRVRAVIIEILLLPLYEGQPTFAELVTHLAAQGLQYRGNIEQVLAPAPRNEVAYIDALFMRTDVGATEPNDRSLLLATFA